MTPNETAATIAPHLKKMVVLSQRVHWYDLPAQMGAYKAAVREMSETMRKIAEILDEYESGLEEVQQKEDD